MKRKILVIEDDTPLSSLLRDQLSRSGYKTYGVRTLAEAEGFFREYEPHLIISDARLPDGDGLSKLPWLSEQAPVIILTAFGSVRDAVAAMHAGAATANSSAFVTKAAAKRCSNQRRVNAMKVPLAP